MNKSKYVIGIKRIKDYSGNLVKEPFLCYASYDKYADHCQLATQFLTMSLTMQLHLTQ